MLSRFRCVIANPSITRQIARTFTYAIRPALRRNFHCRSVIQQSEIPSNDHQSIDQSSQDVDWNNISVNQSNENVIKQPIIDALKKAGFDRPTEIQRMSFDPLTQRQDSIIQSNTGSGKTMAYLLPIIQAIKQSPKLSTNQSNRPVIRCVIVAPTRDLCSQLERVIESLDQSINKSIQKSGDQSLSSAPLSIATVTGANDRILDTGMIDILIANPAGLDSCIRQATTQANRHSKQAFNQSIDHLFGSTDWMVFDEADAMIATSPSLERFVTDLGRLKNRSATQAVEQSQESNEQSNNQTSPQLTTRPSLVFVAATFHSAGLKSAANLVNQSINQSHDQALGESNEPTSTSSDDMSSSHSLKSIKSISFHRPPPSIRQCWIHVEEESDRLDRLVEAIASAQKRSTKQPKILVFFNSVSRLENAYNALIRQGQQVHQTNKQPNKQSLYEPLAQNQWTTLRLPSGIQVEMAKFHKNIPHQQRVSLVEAINQPTNASAKQPIKVLFCTNLAARGVDFIGVTDVVQYDFATSAVDHIHRIGRTGRCAPFINNQPSNQSHNPVQPGVVVNLFNPGDHLLVSNLRSVTMEELQSERTIPQSIDQSVDESISESVEITAFSRKRSFRRKFKKAMKEAELARADPAEQPSDHPMNE